MEKLEDPANLEESTIRILVKQQEGQPMPLNSASVQLHHALSISTSTLHIPTVQHSLVGYSNAAQLHHGGSKHRSNSSSGSTISLNMRPKAGIFPNEASESIKPLNNTFAANPKFQMLSLDQDNRVSPILSRGPNLMDKIAT